MNISGDSSGTAAEEGGVKDNNNHPTTQAACAACKFQRRKCSADCPLAPYFPAHRVQDFQNVRKLFGVKKVLKTLADLEPDNRFKAVECIIFEANCRASDLAGGCYKIICELQSEITLLEAQHRIVLRQLRYCRQTAAISQSGATSSEFDFNWKPGLISEDWIRKENCNLNDRLTMMENEVSFFKALTH